jgi:hypothetical protein
MLAGVHRTVKYCRIQTQSFPCGNISRSCLFLLEYVNIYIHLRGIYTYEVCTPTRYVHIRGRHTYEVCTPTRYVHLRGMYTYEVCTPTKYVRVRGMYTYEVCTPTRDMYSIHLQYEVHLRHRGTANLRNTSVCNCEVHYYTYELQLHIYNYEINAQLQDISNHEDTLPAPTPPLILVWSTCGRIRIPNKRSF